jgi:hypothetical protein
LNERHRAGRRLTDPWQRLVFSKNSVEFFGGYDSRYPTITQPRLFTRIEGLKPRGQYHRVRSNREGLSWSLQVDRTFRARVDARGAGPILEKQAVFFHKTDA